jgi:hypothetical protein
MIDALFRAAVSVYSRTAKTSVFFSASIDNLWYRRQYYVVHPKNNNNNTRSVITTNDRKIDQSIQSLSQSGVDYAVRPATFFPRRRI